MKLGRKMHVEMSEGTMMVIWSGKTDHAILWRGEVKKLFRMLLKDEELLEMAKVTIKKQIVKAAKKGERLEKK